IERWKGTTEEPWKGIIDEKRALEKRADYVYDRVLTSSTYIVEAMKTIPGGDAASRQRDAVEALSALSMIEADIASLTIHDPHPNPGISSFFIQHIKPL